MPDILLLNSPLKAEREEIREDYLPPLGLGYIATYLKKNNIDVEIVDCIYLGKGLQEIQQLLREKKSRYVGINIFSPNMYIVKRIIEEAPSYIKFIIGGQLVKSIYNEIANWETNHEIIVVCGEGELIIPDIVKEEVKEAPLLVTDYARVYVVDKKSIYFPSNISNISLDRSLFSDRIIRNKFNLQEACMVSSRGCIYNCAFCGGAASLNQDVCTRCRSKESIISEIRDIIQFSPQVNSIRMLDDLFLRHRKSIKQAIDIFNEVQLKWRAMAHIYSFKNNFDLLEELEQSGCMELFIGIETGSDRMRKEINKLGTSEEVYECIKAVLSAGINVKGYFMYGLPNEQIEDMQETFCLAQRLHEIAKKTKGKFRTSTFQFRPYHGTKLYEVIKEKGIEVEEFHKNNSLDIFKGRNQFNYSAGNFSECTEEILNEYIIKTLQMNED